MTTMVEYLSNWKQPLPDWLGLGDFSLRNFYGGRTVFYPGSGADSHPLAIFNKSHSAHCFFFVDQEYTAPNPVERLGRSPLGYETIFEKHYSVAELKRESVNQLPKNKLNLLETEPTCIGPRAYGHTSNPEMQAAADSKSAVRLLVYERNLTLGEDHGAERFAVFCLGMEARTAYEWFYGTMFRDSPPFAILLQDHGFGDDFATNRDNGFGDPDGVLYRTAEETGLPEFLIVAENTRSWRDYVRLKGVDPDIGGMAGHKRRLFERKG
ncbi:MAG: hypothetical protein OXI57_11465 [Rhodospirillales bacterium]|nr:hypothetical protein [Rhodospirillales bacterium]